jgi:AcrR family transcriptional regulator
MLESGTKASQREATREAIVSAAMKLFSERGFGSTTIAEIARAAGITKGAIYWHFDSKDSLFSAILDRIRVVWQTTIRGPVQEEPDPVRQIELLFDQYAVFMKSEGEFCLFLQRALLESEGNYARQVAEVFDRTQVFVSRILDQAKQTGQIDLELDSPVVARTILISLTGVTAHCHASLGLSVDSVLAELKRQILSRTRPPRGRKAGGRQISKKYLPPR